MKVDKVVLERLLSVLLDHDDPCACCPCYVPICGNLSWDCSAKFPKDCAKAMVEGLEVKE